MKDREWMNEILKEIVERIEKEKEGTKILGYAEVEGYSIDTATPEILKLKALNAQKMTRLFVENDNKKRILYYLKGTEPTGDEIVFDELYPSTST